MTKNTLTCLINHTKLSSEKFSEKLPRNTILLSRKSDIKTNISIFLNVLRVLLIFSLKKVEITIFFKILKKFKMKLYLALLS